MKCKSCEKEFPDDEMHECSLCGKKPLCFRCSNPDEHFGRLGISCCRAESRRIPKEEN